MARSIDQIPREKRKRSIISEIIPKKRKLRKEIKIKRKRKGKLVLSNKRFKKKWLTKREKVMIRQIKLNFS